MEKIELDLKDCKYEGDIFERMLKTFDYTCRYSQIWDAFWEKLCKSTETESIIITVSRLMSDRVIIVVDLLDTVMEKFREYRKKTGGKAFSYKIVGFEE